MSERGRVPVFRFQDVTQLEAFFVYAVRLFMTRFA
jgi:hypothetical protein